SKRGKPAQKRALGRPASPPVRERTQSGNGNDIEDYGKWSHKTLRNERRSRLSSATTGGFAVPVGSRVGGRWVRCSRRATSPPLPAPQPPATNPPRPPTDHGQAPPHRAGDGLRWGRPARFHQGRRAGFPKWGAS